jgi:glycogen operon protein
MQYKRFRGRPLPLGLSRMNGSMNFSVMCKHGTSAWLVLQPLQGDDTETVIELDPHFNRTGHYWHIRLEGLPEGFRYGWRVDGPPHDRLRFDPSIVLLDPAATLLSGGNVWGQSQEPFPDHTERRSVFIIGPHYDWADDAPPLVAWEDSIIYELHVRGFTCHPSSGVQNPGTFAGLVEKIPYLQSLGVTAVELLPIHEFDETDCTFTNPETGEHLRNLWGYNSIAFASPKGAYAASGPQYGAIKEFRDMVKAFHKAGIEVILDVVFNHTGEGDDRGRTYSFRGLDNDLYYMLTPDGKYLNFSGVGNTLNCNHPVVRDLLMTCLRYWVSGMHVDGFRFDLASILGRDRKGNVLLEPPVVEEITEDGVLADCKLIAEPWDPAGLYQVGKFPYGTRWSEWNGRFRDDVRRFWRGDPDTAGVLATRICGSSDLYEASGRSPLHSINFVTCHDGFTLSDLVSYNQKHNEMNGENNEDGLDENFSWNCGVEGDTDNAAVLGLRRRQSKNLMATLLLSQGVPMLQQGDEFLRTQKGNNNAWCQDNIIGWVDWSLAERNADFLRFTREMIWLRKRHAALRRRWFFRDDPVALAKAKEGYVGDFGPEIVWHGIEPFEPDFGPKSHSIAFALDGRQTLREPDCDFYVAIHAEMESQSFVVPPSPSGRPWRRVVDTALASPLDIVAEDTAPPVAFGAQYLVAPFALVVLISKP